MTSLDVEMTVISLVRDARMLGCAPRHLLATHADMLDEAQEEIARALEKASLELVA